jgi:predicted nucleotide-binding protein (sugar kinase/HSP70/actin superfamily)
MGIDIVISDKTTKQTIDSGSALAVDESCLPLKIYLGHVKSLLSQCTHIFVPRIVRYHIDHYLCAKFAGLPDIVRNTFHIADNRLIQPNIETNNRLGDWLAVVQICRKLGLSELRGIRVFEQIRKTRSDLAFTKVPEAARLRIAVIGHNYLLKDAFFSQHIFPVLEKQDISILTSDNLDNKVIYTEASLYPEVYWQLSAKIVGSASLFCKQSDVDGILAVSSFGCGPDSLTNEYLEHHVLRPSQKPYTIINIDEHSGNAGTVTRVEAFLDLVKWGKQS